MRLSNRSLLIAAIGALGVIWCIAIFTITALLFRQYSGAMTFVLIAVALAILYLTVPRKSPGKQAPEADAPSIYFTVAYVIAAMVSNTVLTLVGRGDFNGFLLLCNAVINAVYILLVLCAKKDSRRVSEQLARTEQKLSGSTHISKKLGEILSITENAELRKQLLALKESVDYSTNISTTATLESEKIMERRLDVLMLLIMHKGELSDIQDKIREVEIIWNTRCSAAAYKG